MTSDNKIKQFDAIFAGLRTEVLQTQYKKYYSEIVRNQLKNNQFGDTQLQAVYNQAMAIRQSEEADQFYFITICPYEDIELQSLIKVMTKVLKKKWLNDYVYVYEQRQDDSDKPIYGIHVHMIVKREAIAKSDVIREVYNTCKNIVGTKQSIDVKLLHKHDMWVRLNYILGQKSTEEKQKKQIIDKVWREKNRIEPYYQNNFLHYIQEYKDNALLSP